MRRVRQAFAATCDLAGRNPIAALLLVLWALALWALVLPYVRVGARDDPPASAASTVPWDSSVDRECRAQRAAYDMIVEIEAREARLYGRRPEPHAPFECQNLGVKR